MAADEVLDGFGISQIPKGSCDCQIHVYDDPARYPVRHENPLYPAPKAPLAEAMAMHRHLGFQRVVVVQATVYTTDHSLLLDSLDALPAGCARGVAIVDEHLKESYLERLDCAGVCAARFNFHKRLGLAPSIETFRRLVPRIRELGWFIKIFATPAELAEVAEEIDRCDVPVVIDHMGRVNLDLGLEQSGVRRVLEMLKRDDRWIMLSNGHRISVEGYPWNDSVPLGRLYYEAAPERCIWGSDWPHVGSPGGRMPDDADLLELLFRYLPDQDAVENVLVRNPAQLFGF